MKSTSIGFFAALVAGTANARAPPSICMLSPLATITAGQPILASVDNPQGRPCVATLVFSDDNFLPIAFDIQPAMCLGYQQAEVLVPVQVPNGEVTVLWECAGEGTNSCSKATIEGGSSDAEGLAAIGDSTGTIECVLPIATLTTFTTIVQSSSTTVDAVVKTIFSTTIPSETSASLNSSRSASSSNSPSSLDLSSSLNSLSSPSSSIEALDHLVMTASAATLIQTMTVDAMSTSTQCSCSSGITPYGSPFK